MATVLEDLTSARAGAAAKLAACLTGDYSSAEEFKPNAGGSNALDRVSYIRELRETIAFLDSEIARLDCWEVTSEMTPG